MTAFIDTSSFIGQVLTGLTGITGSLFLTLLSILLILFILAAAFRLPVESIFIVYFPFIIVVGAYTGDFLPVLGVALIYGASLWAKYLLK